MNLINSPKAKAIVSAIGGGLTFLELALTPHTVGWIIVGALLATATSLGVYFQPNQGTIAV